MLTEEKLQPIGGEIEKAKQQISNIEVSEIPCLIDFLHFYLDSARSNLLRNQGT